MGPQDFNISTTKAKKAENDEKMNTKVSHLPEIIQDFYVLQKKYSGSIYINRFQSGELSTLFNTQSCERYFWRIKAR